LRSNWYEPEGNENEDREVGTWKEERKWKKWLMMEESGIISWYLGIEAFKDWDRIHQNASIKLRSCTTRK